jgi:hypothetical protein
MKPQKADATVGSMWGNKFPKALEYTYSWEAFENYDEIVEAKKVPSHEDIVNLVNENAKLAARSKQALKRIDEEYEKTKNNLYKKPDTSTPEYATEQAIKWAMKRNPKLTREQAQALVESMDQVTA